MTDEWDDPSPRTAGIGRRKLLVGAGGLGAAAVGAITFGPDLLTEEITSIDGEQLGAERVELDAGVSVKLTASVENPDVTDPGIVIGFGHVDQTTLLIEKESENSVSATAETSLSGVHEMAVVADGEFEATLSRQRLPF